MSSGQLTSITKQGRPRLRRRGPLQGRGREMATLSSVPSPHTQDERHLTTLSFKKGEVKKSSQSRRGWGLLPTPRGFSPCLPLQTPGLWPPGGKPADAKGPRDALSTARVPSHLPVSSPDRNFFGQRGWGGVGTGKGPSRGPSPFSGGARKVQSTRNINMNKK